MKLLSLLSVFCAVMPLTASALTVSIDAEVLSDLNGVPLQGGLIILTMAVDGNFHGPSGTNFVTGSEMILAQWNFPAPGDALFLEPGSFSDFIDNLTRPFPSDPTGWDAGDPFRLYWYPDLSMGDALTVGDYYGFYSNAVTDASDPSLSGGDPWILPPEPPVGSPDVVALKFFTSDADFLSLGGPNDATAGRAVNQVRAAGSGTSLPDAGGTLVLLSAGFAGLAAVRRFAPKSRSIA